MSNDLYKEQRAAKKKRNTFKRKPLGKKKGRWNTSKRVRDKTILRNDPNEYI